MKLTSMPKPVAENLVNPTILPNLNLVTRICFVPNKILVRDVYLIVDFMMLMLGYVCLKIKINENMIGLNMRMEHVLVEKLLVQVKQNDN